VVSAVSGCIKTCHLPVCSLVESTAMATDARVSEPPTKLQKLDGGNARSVDAAPPEPSAANIIIQFQSEDGQAVGQSPLCAVYPSTDLLRVSG
jgi:hypothetical protein